MSKYFDLYMDFFCNLEPKWAGLTLYTVASLLIISLLVVLLALVLHYWPVPTLFVFGAGVVGLVVCAIHSVLTHQP